MTKNAHSVRLSCLRYCGHEITKGRRCGRCTVPGTFRCPDHEGTQIGGSA